MAYFGDLIVTDNRQNRDHFQVDNTLSRDNFFQCLFQPTCSADLPLDLYMFSLGTLCLWISGLGHESDYIHQILRSQAVLTLRFSTVFL